MTNTGGAHPLSLPTPMIRLINVLAKRIHCKASAVPVHLLDGGAHSCTCTPATGHTSVVAMATIEGGQIQDSYNTEQHRRTLLPDNT